MQGVRELPEVSRSAVDCLQDRDTCCSPEDRDKGLTAGWLALLKWACSTERVRAPYLQSSSAGLLIFGNCFGKSAIGKEAGEEFWAAEPRLFRKNRATMCL